MYSTLLQRTARVIAVSHAVADETQRLFRVERGRIVTIPNGVAADRIESNADRSEIRRRLDIPSDVFVLLSVGALTWEKNPLAHLRVAESALGRISNAVYVLAGDGPLRREVEARVSRSRYASRIRAVGGGRDVAELIRASDALLFAGRPDGMEGMPAVVIEAGMAGKPVVAYSVAGVPEVVVHGRTGLLAPVGHEPQLVSHIVRLAFEEGERVQLGAAARERCTSAFEIEPIAHRYLQEYVVVTREAASGT
jgi:glycosyltransferase involved in cell wall biosynthesis